MPSPLRQFFFLGEISVSVAFLATLYPVPDSCSETHSDYVQVSLEEETCVVHMFPRHCSRGGE